MISHKDCEHPSTSSARSKCRRGQAQGDVPQKGATVKEVDFSRSSGGPKGSTPRDRDKACDICGVERIAWRGTDPLRGLVIFVGEKCEYYLRRSLDKVAVD